MSSAVPGTPSSPAPATARSAFAIDVPAGLLARASRGEPQAQEQLYRWFERPVHTLALRICGDREAASDVLQETMLRVFSRLHSSRGEAPFWGWLRQIAIHQAFQQLRRRRVIDDALPLDDIDAETDAPTPAAAADTALLLAALQSLPAATRAVLWLYYAEGYTHHEIAGLTGKTASFSKSQVSRGTRRLRTLLGADHSP